MFAGFENDSKLSVCSAEGSVVHCSKLVLPLPRHSFGRYLLTKYSLPPKLPEDANICKAG